MEMISDGGEWHRVLLLAYDCMTDLVERDKGVCVNLQQVSMGWEHEQSYLCNQLGGAGRGRLYQRRGACKMAAGAVGKREG
jgi:hypothetical protein